MSQYPHVCVVAGDVSPHESFKTCEEADCVSLVS